MTDLDETSAAFSRVATKEIAYRPNSLTVQAVLEDVFSTSVFIGLRGFGMPESDWREIVAGVKRFTSFHLDGVFHVEKAINAASKAAYVAMLLARSKHQFERFDPTQNLASVIVGDARFSKLNKIKKTDPEAFFYFHRAVELAAVDR
jgi:hypothetical protein